MSLTYIDMLDNSDMNFTAKKMKVIVSFLLLLK